MWTPAAVAPLQPRGPGHAYQHAGSSAELDGCFFLNTTFCTDLEATAFLSGMLHYPGFTMGRALEVAAPSTP